MITGIVAALPEEISTLTSVKIPKGSWVLIHEHLLIAHSGVGAENARRAAQLLANQGANRLMSWGCAGALAGHLKPGDLILAEAVLPAGHQPIPVDLAWRQTLHRQWHNISTIFSGVLAEALNLISAATEKQRIHNHTNAMAIDMESAAIAKVALENNLPFVAVRAIADPADKDLPAAIAYALNAEGEVEISRLLGFLVRHPGQLPGVIKLGGYFHAAQKTLKKLAKTINHPVSPNHRAR